jgi:hypothetical protein
VRVGPGILHESFIILGRETSKKAGQFFLIDLAGKFQGFSSATRPDAWRLPTRQVVVFTRKSRVICPLAPRHGADGKHGSSPPKKVLLNPCFDFFFGELAVGHAEDHQRFDSGRQILSKPDHLRLDLVQAVADMIRLGVVESIGDNFTDFLAGRDTGNSSERSEFLLGADFKSDTVRLANGHAFILQTPFGFTRFEGSRQRFSRVYKKNLLRQAIQRLCIQTVYKPLLIYQGLGAGLCATQVRRVWVLY